MTNRPHRGRPAGGSHRSRGAGNSGVPGVPASIEPEVRRWPHPVTGEVPEQPPEPAMHYIRCALSYQNQLLAEIKSLLEQLAAAGEKDGQP